MSAYSLTLIGSVQDPSDWNVSVSSADSMSLVLWREFSKIEDIDLRYCWAKDMSSVPRTDAYLVHHYVELAMEVLREVKRRTPKAHVAYFMENPLDPYDHSFAFLPEFGGKRRTVIPFPYDQENLVVCEKEKTSVLIDHTWPPLAGVRGRDNTEEVVDVLTRMDGLELVQCKRTDADASHPAVAPLEVVPYLRYLSMTSRFGKFVVTHKGSYNAAIVDMAVRGTQVIAQGGFVLPSQARAMRIRLYSGRGNLERAVGRPVEANLAEIVRRACVPMNEAVSEMDEYFREVL